MTFIFCFGLPRDVSDLDGGAQLLVDTLSVHIVPRVTRRGRRSERYRRVTHRFRGGAAVAKLSVPKLAASSFKGWTFVLIAGSVLAAIAILDRGGLTEVPAADGSTGCQLEVAADELNVRSGPNQEAPLVETLRRGVRVDGTRVVTNGFRELEDGRWAAAQFLTPLPGTNCA
jgi:hypothetical protein